MPSNHDLKSCDHIVLTYVKVEWDPENITMDRNMPYGNEAGVAGMSRKQSKEGLSDIFHKRNFII